MSTIVQVEQEAGHVFVVDSASSVSFILGNELIRKVHSLVFLLWSLEDEGPQRT